MTDPMHDYNNEGTLESVLVDENGDITYVERGASVPDFRIYAHGFALCVDEIMGVVEVAGVEQKSQQMSVLRLQVLGSCEGDECRREHNIEFVVPIEQAEKFRGLIGMALDGKP